MKMKGIYDINGTFSHQNGIDNGVIVHKNKKQFEEILLYLSSIGGAYHVNVDIGYND
jgi:hypothetical protein